jgi:hypothetical protein
MQYVRSVGGFLSDLALGLKNLHFDSRGRDFLVTGVFEPTLETNRQASD